MSGKWDEWFGNRKWRVRAEASGPGFASAGAGGPCIPVQFDRGCFVIEPPGAFRSPVSGNPGRRGVLLQEVGPDGKDIEGSVAAFGEAAVEKARKDFGAVA